MPPAEPRVVLLARPGAAATRLREALAQAGASVVLDADPTSAGLSALVDAAPDVVLVALDPTVEDVIERFEPVLGDARVDVIYEEAELVATRDGWDLARWQRHLAAKLQRHGNVLPPVPPGEDEAPESIALPDDEHASLAEIADDFAHTAEDAVEAAMAEAVAEASDHAIEVDALDALEGSDALAADLLAADLAGAGLGAREAQPSAHAFDPALAEYDFDTAGAAPVAPFVPDAFVADATFEPDTTFVVEGVEGLGLEARAIDDAPAHGGQFDPTNAEDFAWEPPAALEDAQVLEFDGAVFDPPADEADDRAGGIEPEAPAEGAGDATGATPPSGPALTLELAIDDGSAAVAPDADTTRARFRHDLDALHARIASLELVDDSPRRGPEHARGAVLVLAGIGGPDAVRQLLGALPAEFPRPVLVQQRLDGGRYDKLVAQMQRAAAMTVRLAEAGQPVIGGVVYILPDAMGVEAQGEALRFSEQPGDLLTALPSSDSAVLMFSGSDAALVDAAMNHKWAGAFVAGQTPDGCYDATAPAALVSRGADAGPPAELARQLVERWS